MQPWWTLAVWVVFFSEHVYLGKKGWVGARSIKKKISLALDANT
jgi:hypothetical protein